MKTNDFIGQMVHETISTENSTQQDMLSFENNNFFKLEVSYDKKRMCFVLENDKGTLEVPQNWGPFKNRIASQFYISEFDDPEGFISIISNFFDQEISSIKIILKNPENDMGYHDAA
jgi:hypothetical protein